MNYVIQSKSSRSFHYFFHDKTLSLALWSFAKGKIGVKRHLWTAIKVKSFANEAKLRFQFLQRIESSQLNQSTIFKHSKYFIRDLGIWTRINGTLVYIAMFCPRLNKTILSINFFPILLKKNDYSSIQMKTKAHVRWHHVCFRKIIVKNKNCFG